MSGATVSSRYRHANTRCTYRQTVRREILVSGLSNALFNGLAAWLLLKNGGPLSLTGEPSYAIDIAATAFILPFIITLIVIPLNRRKRRANTVPAIHLDPDCWWQALLSRFPGDLWLRALCFGALTLFLATPLTLVPLWILGLHEFAPAAYSLFKGAWAGLVAAVLTTPMLLLAWKEG